MIFNFWAMHENLNKDLLEIVLKRNELSRLSYNSPEYDIVEEELHDLEDNFDENHGKFLEEVLSSIYKKISPKSDVMVPIAYIAKKYKISSQADSDEKQFDPANNEGIIIDAVDSRKEIMRLVMAPNPTRFLLQEGSKKRTEVWVDE